MGKEHHAIKPVPLLGIAAYSGTGKTTLLKALIPALKQHNIRVGLIKHTHHDVDVDTPGKDSYELRKAGADQTLVANDARWALITETPELNPVDLHYLASRLDSTTLDLILVEGFKHEPIAKIALYRRATGKPFDGLIDSHVIALASDETLSTHEMRTVDVARVAPLPQLDLNNPAQIACFIANWLTGRALK